MPRFVDSHVHLHFPEYREDLAGVLDRAAGAGVRTLINVGTDAADSRRALEIARRHSGIFVVAGIHPHEADHADDLMFSEMESLLRDDQVVGIGEVGLDFYRHHSSREKQEEVFRRFLAWHRELGKPVVIHCREAYEEVASAVKSSGGISSGVMHCYSSDELTMKRFLELGFFISFAGSLTYKRNQGLREACRACPLDRMLLETDGPYLSPEPFRGRRNEPAFLVETAKVAASLHGVTPEEIGERTARNSEILFRLC